MIRNKADLYRLSNPHLNSQKNMVYSGFGEYYDNIQDKTTPKKKKKCNNIPVHREDKRIFQI